MKPRFEPCGNGPEASAPLPILTDPEAYDASEQRFAASLEEKPTQPQFVADQPEEAITPGSLAEDGLAEEPELAACPPPAELLQSHDTDQSSDNPDSWRQELQAKIKRYRARKQPAPPRYPSLQLKFDSLEPCLSSAAAAQDTVSPINPENTEKEEFALSQSSSWATQAVPEAHFEVAADTATVLEFPRLENQAPAPDELAEPVLEQPSILETPEILPPPPALGGILIELPDEEIQERRPGLDLPLQAASMARRVLAMGIDGLVVILAAVLFGYIFFRIAPGLPSLHHIGIACGVIVACLWAGYQYLLLVYAGTTPGLKLCELRLSRFDGRSVPQRVRHWRVLASVLSGLSLGLGYAWCFFDEDRLCWHDRITHTYMAPAGSK